MKLKISGKNHFENFDNIEDSDNLTITVII